MDNTMAVVLAGGRGERLEPLTRERAKPAVPFGGAYRIIDFTLSNCLNSRIRRILLLTQFKSMSLERHVNLGWRDFFSRELDEFIEMASPQQRIDAHWYQGTADAVYQNIYTIEKENPKYIVILAGDHIYKMNYLPMLEQHKRLGADLTVGVIRVAAAASQQLGIIELNAEHRIVGFQEKPLQPKVIPGDEGHCWASMGIYVARADFLFEQLIADALRTESSHDFGRDIIPSIVDSHRVFGYSFVDENRQLGDYWRDVGTLDAYYEANMDLVAVTPHLNLYEERWPIRTYQRVLPPPKFVFGGGDDARRCGKAVDSLVCAGSIVSGGSVAHSILGPRVHIHSYSNVQDSILFEGVDVGRHARIRKAIIEKGIRIPAHCQIGFDPEQDLARGFTVSPAGVVVVAGTPSLS